MRAAVVDLFSTGYTGHVDIAIDPATENRYVLSNNKITVVSKRGSRHVIDTAGTGYNLRRLVISPRTG